MIPGTPRAKTATSGSKMCRARRRLHGSRCRTRIRWRHSPVPISTVTALGFGRDAMNRIQNHKEGGIASVYDRHQYEAENKTIMEAVASKIMALVEGEPGGKVVPIVRR